MKEDKQGRERGSAAVRHARHGAVPAMFPKAMLCMTSSSLPSSQNEHARTGRKGRDYILVPRCLESKPLVVSQRQLLHLLACANHGHKQL